MPPQATRLTVLAWLFVDLLIYFPPRRSLFSPSGQGAGQTFGQQGVYNNMSITVSMAGGSGGAGSLPPMAQAVGNSNLNSVIPVCSDQQVCVCGRSSFRRDASAC